MTDNGSCYRSRTFRQALTDAGVTHKRTRPYRPQINGKVERFNLTLKLEWAYASPTPATSNGWTPWTGSSTATTTTDRTTLTTEAAPMTTVNNLPAKHT